MPLSIDLNCDLGEIDGIAGEMLDLQMMQYVSSINVACGGHAGDVNRIRKVAEWALNRSIAIGAHPGYADRSNFGRVVVPMSTREIHDLVVQQVSVVARIVTECGGRLHHVKPHGALYNLAATSRETADAIARAVHKIDSRCLISGLSGSQLILAADSAGLHAVHEIFADRNYAADGTLVPRQHPGAVLHDPSEIALRAAAIVESGKVTAIDGSQLVLNCESLCIHSDTPAAVSIAEAICGEFRKRRISIQAIESSVSG